MEHATQVELGRTLFTYIDKGEQARSAAPFANPVRDYICRDQAGRERDLLFRDHPLILGMTADLPNPGDFFTNDFTGRPILVVRGKDGKVNAFLNVCRHRGAKLATADLAQGCARTGGSFTCPYHGWAYGLDGRLLGVREADAFGEVDRSTHGLRRLAAVERNGFIWVRPGGEEPFDPDALLGTLAPEMAAYRFERYSHYETRTLRRAMNWKLVIGTFLEGYHIKVLHRNTISSLLLGAQTSFDPYGRNLRMAVPRAGFETLRETPEHEWDVLKHTAVVYELFPNTVLVWQGDHMETWRVFPGNTPDESVMHASLYIPEPALTDKAKRHWDRNMKLLLDTVEKEDFPLGEDMQRGFHSGAQDRLLFGRNEPALAHFHRSVHEALGLQEACGQVGPYGQPIP
jgi:phenylpropionate dioxygenase-like ring-hydroxylating dioxygenase large terminal subunit